MVDEHNLSVDTIMKTQEATLNKWISKVGFHNRKAKHIKEATKILKDKHNGLVPSNYDDLIALPGVGPKMAHLVLQEAFDDVQGISVDTHVHRISNRIGWVKSTTTPGRTADQLEAWLPKENWGKVNGMLVGFGQTICKPIRPLCYECGVKNICPFKPKTKTPSSSPR